jgi:hypothetical protein
MTRRFPAYLKWPLAIIIGVGKHIITLAAIAGTIVFTNKWFRKKKGGE